MTRVEALIELGSGSILLPFLRYYEEGLALGALKPQEDHGQPQSIVRRWDWPTVCVWGGINQFYNPQCVAVLPSGDILIGSTGGRIQQYRPDGKNLQSLGKWDTTPRLAFGPIAKPGQLDTPKAISVDISTGLVYILDTVDSLHDETTLINEFRQIRAQMRYIQIFEPNGAFVGSWGAGGNKPDKFNSPTDMVIHKKVLYVADTHMIKCFQLDGTFVRAFGKEFMLKPMGLAISAADEMFVCDIAHDCVQVFNLEGQHIYSWGWFDYGWFDYGMHRPYRIAIAAGQVIVGDETDIRVFTNSGQFIRRLVMPANKCTNLPTNMYTNLPTNSTYLPTNSTNLLTNSTNLPTNMCTNLPTNCTNLPTNSTNLPTNSTNLPTNKYTNLPNFQPTGIAAGALGIVISDARHRIYFEPAGA